MEQHGIRTELGDINRNIDISNQKLRQLNARISKLQSWMKEANENAAPPTLADTISNILSRRTQPGKSEISQSIYNLKNASYDNYCSYYDYDADHNRFCVNGSTCRDRNSMDASQSYHAGRVRSDYSNFYHRRSRDGGGCPAANELLEKQPYRRRITLVAEANHHLMGYSERAWLHHGLHYAVFHGRAMDRPQYSYTDYKLSGVVGHGILSLLLYTNAVKKSSNYMKGRDIK